MCQHKREIGTNVKELLSVGEPKRHGERLSKREREEKKENKNQCAYKGEKGLYEMKDFNIKPVS